MTWRSLIVDDHEVVRAGVRDVLQEQANITICAEASDGLEGILMWRTLKPDLVILDDDLPKINGMIVADTILQEDPRQRILVFGTMYSELVARRFLRAGVRALIWKTDPITDLVRAVNALRQSRIFFTKLVDDLVLRGYVNHHTPGEPTEADTDLSLREQQIVQLIAEGRSTKEVASILQISTKTAETHRQNAMAKLGIHNVAQLTRYAIQMGIIKIDALSASRVLGAGQSRESIEAARSLLSKATAA